jgi:DNA-binding NarL/FixJ family response regulator
MAFKIVLVDDHKVLRDGLKAILTREGEFAIVGETENGADAVQLTARLSPDVVLMDIGLPGLNGIEASAEILRHSPGAKIVILSMHGDENLVLSAIRAGVRGFVLKRSSSNDVIDALRVVARGGTYLSSKVSDVLLSRVQRGEPLVGGKNPLAALSPREAQVLRLIAAGKGSKEVAAALALEHNTVRSYRKTLMKKLGVNNLASLIQVASSAGLLNDTSVTTLPD